MSPATDVMTANDHLKVLVGDLVFTIARLSAENDALKAQIAEASKAKIPNGE